jgi:hypothetical protein
MCKNHPKALIVLAPDYCFSTMLNLFIFAFKSDDVQFSKTNLIIVCGSLLYLFEYLYKVIAKQNFLSADIAKVLIRESQKIDGLLEGVFDLVLNHDISLMWSVNKLILLIAILFEDKYHVIKNKAISKISEDFEVRQKIEEAFVKLFNGVSKRLDSKNKDLYTKNFGDFKQTITSLI